MKTKQELLNWYQKEAKRTCPGLGNEATNLSHMVMGICSEYSELLIAKSKKDHINISEEIADKFWYLANYCTFRNYSLSELWKERNNELLKINVSDLSINNYFYCLAELQDIVKKNLAYNKPIDRGNEKDKLVSYMITMELLWFDFDFDIIKSLQNNIDKLRIRFPDKFEQHKAINRNLKLERKELEK